MIVCVITINGQKALALFDLGSTTDSITPEFGFVSSIKQFKLDEQVTLQLGCVGSCSKISHGAITPVDIVGVRADMYFNIVNTNHYDTILGTLFLEKYGVCIDFKCRGVVSDEIFHKNFSLSKKITFLAQKGGTTERRGTGRSAPRDTAPIWAPIMPQTNLD